MIVKRNGDCETVQNTLISHKFLDSCKDKNESDIFAMLANDRAKSIGLLLEEKNKAYGNSVSIATKAVAILYPDGIPLEKLDDALVVVRIFDKLARIARGNKKAFGESPWKDIAGYSILQMTKDDFKEVLEFVRIRHKWESSVDPSEELINAKENFIEEKDGLPTMRDGEIDHALSEEEIGAEMKRVFDAQKKLEEK